MDMERRDGAPAGAAVRNVRAGAEPEAAGPGDLLEAAARIGADRERGADVFGAALKLLLPLERGVRLTKTMLRTEMTKRFKAGNASGMWEWKDASDAAETAVNLFLYRYGHVMNTEPDALSRLDSIEAAAELEPPQTARSGEQIRLQEFSTPTVLAHCVAEAAALRASDRVLEPSAGTGTLAVMAWTRIDPARGGRIVLNEYSPRRAEILRRIFDERGAEPAAEYNAEQIHHRIPHYRPTAVLMNPPFSRTPTMVKRRGDTDLRHIAAAYRLLAPGGRLCTISSEACRPEPDSADWRKRFDPDGAGPSILYSRAAAGRLYQPRGTSFGTRLTVLEKPGTGDGPVHTPQDYRRPQAETALELIRDLADILPDRREPEAVETAAPVRRGRPAAPGPARAPHRGRKTLRRTGPAWGAEVEVRAVGSAETAADKAETAGGKPFAAWRPAVRLSVPATAHPTDLVESAAMASVRHRTPDRAVRLPKAAVDAGALSEAQIESVLLAAAAHGQQLGGLYVVSRDWARLRRVDAGTEAFYDDAPGGPEAKRAAAAAHLAAQGKTGIADPEGDDPETAWSPPLKVRRGWMLGDGTGTGKGRQVAGIIADAWAAGRTRSLWVSQSQTLIEDAQRDWRALGGDPGDIFPLRGVKANDPVARAQGVMFATYAALRTGATEERRSRVEQVVEWLAGGGDAAARIDADPVIIFDESHAMAGAAAKKGSRGVIAPSKQGAACLRLQNALPNASVTYVSATGASSVDGLAYAARLGLWCADDTPFENREAFSAAMQAGGIAALELMARDMKALGLYQCRALSYEGIEIEMLRHEVGPGQQKVYNNWAHAFRIIHRNMQKALEAAGVTASDGKTLNATTKGAAVSRFEAVKQRFFNHMLCAMKTPTVLRKIEEDVEAGRAAVVQLVSTGEALTDRRLSAIPHSAWGDVQIDLTPREYVMEYLQHAFPTTLYEEYQDEEGAVRSRPVLDGDGKPVPCPEAVALREELLDRLGAEPSLPTAMDSILHHFGKDRVAEVSGRSKRVIKEYDGEKERDVYRVEKRAAGVNLVETAAFQDGDKKILVFSRAGGTGRSYHDEIGGGNRRRRRHYLLEAGWQSDQAIQGLGRSHRTHQATAPVFVPVTTDIKGERRFVSTIAARLAALGAITRGQRDSQSAVAEGGGALFREEDNFESEYAKAALSGFLSEIAQDRIRGWSNDRFEEATGLRLTDADGAEKTGKAGMAQVLNRLLALPIEEQNQLFGELEKRIDERIRSAKAAGTYDVGVEELNALSIVEEGGREVPGTAAAVTKFKVEYPIRKFTAEDAFEEYLYEKKSRTGPALVINRQSKRAAVLAAGPALIDGEGGVVERVRIIRPFGTELVRRTKVSAGRWSEALEDDWRSTWKYELSKTPDTEVRTMHLVHGTLLPIWHKLPKTRARVYRLVTDAGRRYIGRLLDEVDLAHFEAAAGLIDGAEKARRAKTFDNLMESGREVVLTNGWRIVRMQVEGEQRLTVQESTWDDIKILRRLGCGWERISWKTIVTVPDEGVYARIIERHPILH